MHRSFRYSGVAAVATLWTTLLVGAVTSGFDLFGPDAVSYLGTVAGTVAVLFTVGLVVSALLFVAFHQYVRSRYPTGLGFSVAMLVGMAGQVVAGFVPIGGDGLAHRVHTSSGLILGLSLPLLMWRFAAAQPAGRWRRLTYGLFWAEAVACAVGLYLSGRSVAAIAEILPALAFHIWVITLTFSSSSGRVTTPVTPDTRPSSGSVRGHDGPAPVGGGRRDSRAGGLHRRLVDPGREPVGILGDQ